MRVDSIEAIRRSTTPIPVAELIKGVIEDLKHGEESRLIVRADPNLQTVLAPLHTLQQAITVLIRNAFDASPAEAPVELIIERVPGEVVISVVDHGHGMPADIVRRAGQPFFTTKDPGKGMGLGLFLVRLVAERAGGRFVLNSTEGVGTRTQLHLPEPTPAANSE
jgi:two-component system sensor histidine kinase RegB